MKNIAIITENFFHPWKASDIENFLGGSQECVVLLSEAFVRAKYSVNVFLHGPMQSVTELRNGVIYQDFSQFDLTFPWDTIILFKINPLPDDLRLSNINVIFWSSDVQKTIPNGNKYIKNTVCLTEFHKQKNEWSNAYVFPHGVETKNVSRIPKIANTMLYCSSPDRGLATLLQNWENILKWCPDMKLYVTYGYKISKDFSSDDDLFHTLQAEENLKKICNDYDIVYKGDVSKAEMEKLYQQCKYWVLPLNNLNSELFCLNAIKAQNHNCIPVIYKKGALEETVGKYIDFDNFVKGKLVLEGTSSNYPNYTWDEVVEKFWKAII